MSQIVNTLPALPNDMPFENYCLSYNKSSGIYEILNFNSLQSYVFDENGQLYVNSFRCYLCVSDGEKWEPYYISMGGAPPILSRDEIIASTVDIYNSDGTIFCSATKNDYFKDNVSLISSSITASTLTAVLNDTRNIMPLLIFALIGFIAFRKALNLLKGVFKGA